MSRSVSARKPLWVLTGPEPSMDALVLENAFMAENQREIEEIYRKYGGMVWRRCFRLLGAEQEADDATHDVFVCVLRSYGRFRRQSSSATWLYRIATNTCLNRIRDRSNRERLEKENLGPADIGGPVDDWSFDLVLRVMSEYDEITREAAIYTVVEGMTYNEAAEAIGCSVARVRKQVAKFNASAHKKALRLLKGRS